MLGDAGYTTGQPFSYPEVGRDGAPGGVTMPGIDAAADAGHEGALKLESFFVGHVVGSFSRLRPAAGITRQIVGDCEVRLAELAALLPAGAPGAP